MISFNYVHDLIKQNYGKTGLLKLFDVICKLFLNYSEAACNIYIGDYAPVIIDSLLDHYMTGEYICSFSPICDYMHVQKLDADDYAKEILKDKPKKDLPEIPENPKKWRVMHLTDLHTDLQYTEGSAGECNDPTCCQPQNKAISKRKSNLNNFKFLVDEKKNDLDISNEKM